MTALGDVLEVLYAAQRPRFLTMRAFGRIPAGPSGAQRSSRFWWDRPDRKRHESGHQVIVERDGRWWTYHPVYGGQASDPTGGGTMGAHPFENMMNTRQLIAGQLEVRGETTVAKRPAVAVTVRAYPQGQWLGFYPGEQDFEVALDAATGIALRIATDLFVTEIDEIAFDEVFPDELFQSPIPAGAPMRSMSTREREVDVAELTQAAPFPIRFPRVLPAGARLVKATLDGLDPPAWAELAYVLDPAAYLAFSIRQGPTADDPVGGQVELVGDVEIEIVDRTGPSQAYVRRRYETESASVSVAGPDAATIAVAIAAGLDDV